MRAVVDTNILVRAVIRPQGTVGPVLLRLRQGEYTLLYAWESLEELIDVLNRPRIRQKYGLTDQDIETVIGLILLRGEDVASQERIVVCRDPKDDKFLEAALVGGADYIVSDDADLLELGSFEGMPILRPEEFLG